MKISIVLAHPDPTSFNVAIGKTVREALAENGHVVYFHDLYAEQFDPLLRSGEIPKDAELDPVLRQYCEEIAHADGIVSVHPNWWGQPPAILKGCVLDGTEFANAMWHRPGASAAACRGDFPAGVQRMTGGNRALSGGTGKDDRCNLRFFKTGPPLE